MIRDKNMDWKRDSRWIDGEMFGLGAVASTQIQSLGAGAPPIAEVSTFGYGALLMEAAGDEGGMNFLVPRSWDPAEELGFTVWWSSGSSDTADTITFIVLVKFFAEGTALTAPAALDTVITIDTVTGANHVQKTNRGKKNKNWLTHAQVDAGAMCAVNVEMDAFAAGLTEAKNFLGLEIDFMPRRCKPDFSI